MKKMTPSIEEVIGELEKIFPFDKFYPHITSIIGPKDTKISLEYVIQKPHKPNEEIMVSYVCIGQDMYVEMNAHKHAKSGLFPSTVIKVPKGDPSFLPRSVVYMATMVAAIGENNFTDQKVLDLGAGGGSLSILSLQKGASKIAAVEIDSSAIKNFRKTAYSNNTPNIIIFKGDLRGRWLEQKLKLKPDYINQVRDTTVVIANIGPQQLYPNGTHLAAIGLLDYLPNAHSFFGSGYFRGNNGRLLETDKAYQLLQKKGFDIETEYKATFSPHIGECIAFKATKQRKF